MSAVFRIDLSKLNTTLDRAVRSGVANAAEHIKTTIKNQFGQRSGGKSSAPGSPPNRQKGALSRSITATMLSDRRATIGSNLVYAAIHEHGGVIRPVRANYLWMPIGAKTGESPTAVIAKKKEFAFIPRRSGGFFVVRKSKSGRKTKSGLVYVLLNAVYMPRRPYMVPGLQKSKPGLLQAFKLGAAKHFGVGA